MIFEVLTFELPKKSWAGAGLEVYEKKISPFIKIQTRYLKAPPIARKNHQEAKKYASKILEEAIDPSAYVVCFDERGVTVDSIEFSKKLNLSLESGKQKVQWIVGGPYGVSDSIRKKSTFCIGLSALVMNQEVALLVAFEQIYRAFTIRNGLPYHNE